MGLPERMLARLYRWTMKKELEEGPMVSQGDCAEAQRECRKGIYKRIESVAENLQKAIESKVSRFWFLLIVGGLLTIGTSVLGYSIFRSNDKASKKDLHAAEIRLQAMALEARTRAQLNTEQAMAIKTRQISMADDIRETKEDVKQILERLPPR